MIIYYINGNFITVHYETADLLFKAGGATRYKDSKNGTLI